MKVYNGFSDKRLKPKNRGVAIGVFDGVHRGHQAILKTAVFYSRAEGWSSTVVTFDPDPLKILSPKTPHPVLISLEHRLNLFEQFGIQEVVVVAFDQKFSKIPHDYFLNVLLIHKLGTRRLVVGDDFRFGAKGLGDAAYLRKAESEGRLALSVVSPLKYAGQTVSSTFIRGLIQKGYLVNAEKMLGRAVTIRGTVVKGNGRGRKIGYPTANLNPHHETLPPQGVYAVRGRFGKKILKGVVHIGPRPTFKEAEASVEVHFLNFKGNLYGKTVELEFSLKIREVQRFKTPGELQKTIEKDIRKALHILS